MSAIEKAALGIASAAQKLLKSTIDNTIGYDIVLVAGQSNSMGWDSGAVDPRLDYVAPGILQWSIDGAPGRTDIGGNVGLARKAIPASHPLLYPTRVGNNPNVVLVSPAIHFANKLRESTSTQRTIVLVPTSAGGTKLTNSRWDPANNGDLYSQSRGVLVDALTVFPNARCVAIYWVQGEQDATENVTGADYQSAMGRLIEGFRSVAGAQDAVMVVGSMVPTWVATNVGTAQAIDAVHRQTPLLFPNTIFVNGGETLAETNGIHYIAPAYRKNGARAGQKYSVATNLSANAPTTPGTPVANGNGRVVSFQMPSSDAPAFDVGIAINGAAETIVRLYPAIYKAPGDVMFYTHSATVGQSVAVRVRAVSRGGSSAWTPTLTYTVAAIGNITSNLLGLYEFNNSGALGSDTSGAGNNGTVSGVLTTTSDIRRGSVLAANVPNGFIRLPVACNLPVVAYTKCGWVNFNGTTGTVPYANIMSGQTNNYFAFRPTNFGGQLVNIWASNDHGFDTTAIRFDNPKLNTWEHWAVVYNSTDGSFRMYRNAELVASRLSGTAVAVSQTLYINSYAALDESNMSGFIDNVRLYSRALSQADIAAIYASEYL